MSKGTWQLFMCEARISNDLELKYTPSGTAVLSFSAASNESWKDQSGQAQEKVEFHRFVAWQKSAEMIAQYFKKGDRIRITGKLETRKWEKDGQTHYTTEIKVDRWDFVDSKNSGATTSNEPPAPNEPSAPPVGVNEPSIDEGDDLPF